MVARIVTGLTKSVSLFNLYRECGWVPLMERRKEQKLVFMYKAINGIVPSYLTDHIPPLVRETTNYPLRNDNNVTFPLHVPKSYTGHAFPLLYLYGTLLMKTCAKPAVWQHLNIS